MIVKSQKDLNVDKDQPKKSMFDSTVDDKAIKKTSPSLFNILSEEISKESKNST